MFFRVLGIALMVFAAGLLADAVQNMQELGWLPFLGHHLWSSAGILNEQSALGDVFHSLVGYADQPTALQVLVWVVFVATALDPVRAPRPAHAADDRNGEYRVDRGRRVRRGRRISPHRIGPCCDRRAWIAGRGAPASRDGSIGEHLKSRWRSAAEFSRSAAVSP